MMPFKCLADITKCLFEFPTLAAKPAFLHVAEKAAVLDLMALVILRVFVQ